MCLVNLNEPKLTQLDRDSKGGLRVQAFEMRALKLQSCHYPYLDFLDASSVQCVLEP